VSALLSINSAIDRLDELRGKPVEVEGLLRFEFEDVSLWHWPKAEQRDVGENQFFTTNSSLWLAFGSGSLQPNEKVLASWSGKRVRVSGILRGPTPQSGCGHVGGWPGEIEPYSIERV
jgi:hypothetical protein